MALEYLHSVPMLIRDLKPGNVVIDSDGNAKLIDFGYCLLELQSENHLFSFACPPGTPGYAPPEILLGQPYDYKADLYCFGVSVGMLFTGGCSAVEGWAAPPSIQFMKAPGQAGCRPSNHAYAEDNARLQQFLERSEGRHPLEPDEKSLLLWLARRPQWRKLPAGAHRRLRRFISKKKYGEQLGSRRHLRHRSLKKKWCGTAAAAAAAGCFLRFRNLGNGYPRSFAAEAKVARVLRIISCLNYGEGSFSL